MGCREVSCCHETVQGDGMQDCCADSMAFLTGDAGLSAAGRTEEAAGGARLAAST